MCTERVARADCCGKGRLKSKKGIKDTKKIKKKEKEKKALWDEKQTRSW